MKFTVKEKVKGKVDKYDETCPLCRPFYCDCYRAKTVTTKRTTEEWFAKMLYTNEREVVLQKVKQRGGVVLAQELQDRYPVFKEKMEMLEAQEGYVQLCTIYPQVSVEAVMEEDFSDLPDLVEILDDIEECSSSINSAIDKEDVEKKMDKDEVHSVIRNKAQDKWLCFFKKLPIIIMKEAMSYGIQISEELEGKISGQKIVIVPDQDCDVFDRPYNRVGIRLSVDESVPEGFLMESAKARSVVMYNDWLRTFDLSNGAAWNESQRIYSLPEAVVCSSQVLLECVAERPQVVTVSHLFDHIYFGLGVSRITQMVDSVREIRFFVDPDKYETVAFNKHIVQKDGYGWYHADRMRYPLDMPLFTLERSMKMCIYLTFSPKRRVKWKDPRVQSYFGVFWFTSSRELVNCVNRVRVDGTAGGKRLCVPNFLYWVEGKEIEDFLND
jgi:hypothetical protein